MVCLGYPFHAPATPEKLRTAHLETLACPALIVQGTRDPFGSQPEVEALALSPAIQVHWIGDGDHDFGWDFDHLVNHPWATIACVALVLAAGWGLWRLMSSRPSRQEQPLKRD